MRNYKDWSTQTDTKTHCHYIFVGCAKRICGFKTIVVAKFWIKISFAIISKKNDSIQTLSLSHNEYYHSLKI